VLLPRQKAKLARGAKAEEHAMSQPVSTTIAVMGIDIGKNSFHAVGLDQRGAIVLRQRWSRSQVERRLANMPPCLIGMEACVGAHHLSRKLKGLGHDARLMPAKYVRPYSKGQKNDRVPHPHRRCWSGIVEIDLAVSYVVGHDGTST
jgi:transposase